ncbi:MAG TPA: S9 family peptidase [Terracidiphilus sp.]|nr:S9 family peptidase [Terracidiphilus sp.]
MKRALVFALVLVFCPAALASSSPEDRTLTDPGSVNSVSNSQARAVPIGDLFYTRSTGGAAWSPDGSEIVFTTDMTGRPNLWKVKASGGWPLQLVQSDDRQFGAAWSPDGKWIVYQQDKGGNEMWDLYAVPANGGEAVNLTNTPDIREQRPLWCHNGRMLALEYKAKDSPVYDIALMDWTTKAVRKLTNEETKNHAWAAVAWSPDDKTLFATRSEISGESESDIYAIDTASGKAENLTTHQGKVLFDASSLSPDGETLLITSNQKNGFNNVALLDVASKRLTWATDTRWDASAGIFSPDGKTFTYLIDEDGRIDAYLADRTSMRAEKINFPAGLNYFAGNPSPFSPRGDRLLVGHQSSIHPGDLWIYDVATRRPTQLTFSAVASLETTPLPAAQIVHYKTFDGKTISALLWVPFNLRRDGSNPALVLPHGGPTGQMVDYWNPEVAALVSRGYVCIAPNVRGSTGYGKAFQNANYQDLGGGDLQDEVYAARFLEATGYVNAKKIGITGGSYGGYMTMMALAKTPDVWSAGVEEFGIINWFTMLQHEDALLQQYEKSLLGDPVKDRKIYEADSPITYIHDVRSPLLVLQGENDPRVPKEEAQQVVSELKKDGKIVDAHYYAQEGHGFAKREDRIDAIERTVSWFDRYLKAQ